MASTSDPALSATRSLNIYSHDYSSPDDEPVCCVRSRAAPSRYSHSSRSSDSSPGSSSSSRSSVPSSVSSSCLLSSKVSPLSSLSSGTWQSEEWHKTSHSQAHHYTQGSTQASFSKSVRSDSVANHATRHARSEARQPEAVPVDQRQHPRRTQRLINGDNKHGDLSAPCTRAPPTLVRQSERKDVFVDSLVDTTTQMIETIWPLSVLSCTRDSPLAGPDQNLIGLRTFVQEVLRRSKTSYSTLQVALYYLILIKPFVPNHDFTMEQLVDSQLCRAMQCGRRMFLTALILASKYLQDRNYSARAWSKISGLRTSEINANEMAFLAAIKWKLHIPEPLFNRWTDIVIKCSPSSSTPPTSPSTLVNPWRSIILRVTPDLDEVEFGSASISKDSNHQIRRENIGPSALPTPPLDSKAFPLYEFNEETAANPYRAPKVLEPTPCATVSNRPILPPIRCPGLLPTPTMTPQTGTFCTPAVSAYGLCGVKSSMGAAMAQVQNNILSRSTLDNPNGWKPPVHTSVPTFSRRSSLAPSSSNLSSPESLVSDVSSRSSSSRSSSISSAASLTCALPQLRLAMQATRRCAQMKLSSLKEGEPSILSSSPPEDPTWDVFHASPDDVSTTEGDYFSKTHRTLPPMQPNGPRRRANVYKPSTHEAGTILHEVALNCRPANSGLTSSRKRENNSSTDLSIAATRELRGGSHRTMPSPPTTSRKRERTSSTDLSVQSRVRDLIAPRCLGDVTNGTRFAGHDSTILPDQRIAESFLVLNKNSTSQPNTKLNDTIVRDTAPRKRTCSGGRKKENCKPNHDLVKERFAIPAPGMWDGII